MKNIIYIIIISVLITSCKEKEIKKEATQNLQTPQDSIIIKEFEERKSIHQQEWEEYQEESVTDSI